MKQSAIKKINGRFVAMYEQSTPSFRWSIGYVSDVSFDPKAVTHLHSKASPIQLRPGYMSRKAWHDAVEQERPLLQHDKWELVDDMS